MAKPDIPRQRVDLLLVDTDDRSGTSMNVSLPKSLRGFVDERVWSSSYASASKHVRELVRRDRERRVRR